MRTAAPASGTTPVHRKPSAGRTTLAGGKPADPRRVAKPRAGADALSPRLADRRRKFVQAAEQLFLKHGFAGASVNEIVRIAGGSLSTLYAEFGTKEALFEAVLSRRAAAIFEDGLREPAHIADVAAELRLLATRIQARMLSDDGLAIYRLAVSEAPRFPALRKTVLESGLRGFLRHLTGYFAELGATGRIRIDDPALAAEHFLTLVQGQLLFVACCGSAPGVGTAGRRTQVRNAVCAFLKIYPLSAKNAQKDGHLPPSLASRG